MVDRGSMRNAGRGDRGGMRNAGRGDRGRIRKRPGIGWGGHCRGVTEGVLTCGGHAEVGNGGG